MNLRTWRLPWTQDVAMSDRKNDSYISSFWGKWEREKRKGRKRETWYSVNWQKRTCSVFLGSRNLTSFFNLLSRYGLIWSESISQRNLCFWTIQTLWNTWSRKTQAHLNAAWTCALSKSVNFPILKSFFLYKPIGICIISNRNWNRKVKVEDRKGTKFSGVYEIK